MTKFIVNKGLPSERTIKADGHYIADGYFHFQDDDGEVATILQGQVSTIERDDSAS